MPPEGSRNSGPLAARRLGQPAARPGSRYQRLRHTCKLSPLLDCRPPTLAAGQRRCLWGRPIKDWSDLEFG